MEKIEVEVDDAIGKAYQKFDAIAKQKFNDFINYFLKKVINDAGSTGYEQLLDKIGNKAELSGLNPEILSELLNNND